MPGEERCANTVSHVWKDVGNASSDMRGTCLTKLTSTFAELSNLVKPVCCRACARFTVVPCEDAIPNVGLMFGGDPQKQNRSCILAAHYLMQEPGLDRILRAAALFPNKPAGVLSPRAAFIEPVWKFRSPRQSQAELFPWRKCSL